LISAQTFTISPIIAGEVGMLSGGEVCARAAVVTTAKQEKPGPWRGSPADVAPPAISQPLQ